MKPKTLVEIWMQSKYRDRFRVRNINTLKDYLVTGISCRKQGVPVFMDAICCDLLTFQTSKLDCGAPVFALLSSEEEMRQMVFGTTEDLVRRVKARYRIAERICR